MNKKSVLFISILAAILFFTTQGLAKTAQLEIVHSQDKYLPGNKYPIAFRIKIAKSWYLHGADTSKEELLMPTKISFTQSEGIRVLDIQFPEPKLKKFDYSQHKIKVFSGDILVRANLEIHKDLPPGKYYIKGVLEYQACTTGSCAPPEKVPFSVTVSVARKGENIALLNQEIFKHPASVRGFASATPGRSRFDTTIWLSLFLVFIGGLALNLTPCVYPLIPITISYFGGRSESLAGKKIIHGLIYMCGLSITNSILGVAAAVSGGMLGAVLQNPFVLGAVAAILFVLGLSFFGLWEFRVPTGMMNIASKSFGGFFGTFFMGLTLGIVAAPCLGPFILGLLSYVGQKGDPYLGFLYFFVLSLGLGLPLAVLAVFSGSLEKLPMSGDWMIWVRKCLGWVLIGMAAYMVRPLIPSATGKALLFGIIFFGAGLHIGWLDKSGHGIKRFVILKRLSGVILFFMAVFSIYGIWEKHEGIKWIPYEKNLLQTVLKAHKPIMIDFYADWCTPCREMDETTFVDSEVVHLSKDLITIRVDLTRKVKGQDDLLKRFRIRGVPTIIFIDGNGKEIRQLRIDSYVGKKKLIEHMKRVMNQDHIAK